MDPYVLFLCIYSEIENINKMRCKHIKLILWYVQLKSKEKTKRIRKYCNNIILLVVLIYILYFVRVLKITNTYN
jgi:hypothetical protein